MAESSRSKTLLSLSWPLIISFTFRSLLSSIDIPYASHVGDAAVAAIGLFFPLEFCFIACWVGTSAALTSYLSKAMGERNDAQLRQLVRVSTWIVVVLMLFFLAVAALTWALADDLGLEADVAENFGIYAPVAMAGISLFAFWSIIPDSIIKAHHDTKSTMVAGLISGLGNLGLNTLFVFGFGWGILGIGLATGLARVGSLAYALYRARKLEQARREAWGIEATAEKPCIDRPLKALLALGVPSALTFILMATEGFLVNWVLSRLDDSTAAIAAYAIYHRAVLITLMPIIGVGVAILPFVARLKGEGAYADIRRQLRGAFLAAGAYALLVVFPLCFFGARPIADFLGKAESTRELAAFAIRYATPVGVLVGAPFLLCRPAFEALQRGTPALIMATVRYLFFSGPLALLGAHLASDFGHEPFMGLILGLLLGTLAVSGVFTLWLSRALRSLGD